MDERGYCCGGIKKLHGRCELKEHYLPPCFLAGRISMREGAVASALTYFEKAKTQANTEGKKQVADQARFFSNTIKPIEPDRKEGLVLYRNQLKELQNERAVTKNDTLLARRIFMAKIRLAAVMLKENMAGSASFYINDILKSALEFQKDSCLVNIR